MNMRAKLRVSEVKQMDAEGKQMQVTMHAVVPRDAKPFGPQGESEDNTFARYTPSATLVMQINNPALIGAYKVDDVLYVDFTLAPVQNTDEGPE